MKLLKFTLISILGLSLCTACGGDGDGGETPGPGKPEGPDKSSTTGIDRFDASNIFSRNTYLPDNTAMQGFNLDSDGSVWYTQLSNTNQAQLNWVRAQPNKTPDMQTENKDYMKLTYFGHGTNTALEEDGADRYLWAGAYGVCNAKGQYWNEKLVGRVKYVKGATVKTNECNDYYYIGDYTDLHPSIDAENDLLTINYGDSKNSSYRCFVIYKLSEAKKAPMTNVTITCTDGFQTDRPASTNPVSVVVRCHDLTTLTPVARPRFLKTGYGASGATYYDWQGYDVHKNRLYYTEGQSNYNLFGSFYSGSSFAYVTVFDFEGNIVEERTQVAVVSDKDKLTQIGVSVFGSLEAEGIKVCKDKLYLGYTARGITADSNFVLFGIPLATSVFGEEGTLLATMMVAIVIPVYNITAVVILELFRGGKVPVSVLIKNILKNPMIRGALLGFIFHILGIKLPVSVEGPIKQFANLTTPLALFVLGGTLHFNAIGGNLKYVVPSMTFKMVILPAVILAVATLLGFSGVERFVYFEMYATPVATASYAMAQNMGGDGGQTKPKNILHLPAKRQTAFRDSGSTGQNF